MSGSKLNGSVNLLAKAMRQVFTEAVEEGIEPKRKDMTAAKGRLERRTNEGFAQDEPATCGRRKDTASDVDGMPANPRSHANAL